MSDKTFLDDEAMDAAAGMGPVVDPGPMTEDEISGMVAAMVLLPALQTAMEGWFRKEILDRGKPYNAMIKKAMRRGTWPRVELLVYQDGAAN